jgi:hypothetical protein
MPRSSARTPAKRRCKRFEFLRIRRYLDVETAGLPAAGRGFNWVR